MIPAIVLGDGISALGALRSLAMCNIPTRLWTTPKSPLLRSRWAHSMNENPLPENELELAAGLRSLPFERAFLLACSDSLVRSVALLPPELSARYPSPLAPWKALSLFQNKKLFASLLSECEVPYPRSYDLSDSSVVGCIPSEIFPNAFLKPCDSQSFFSYYGQKGFFVDSPADLQCRLDFLRDTPCPLILQEFIPGPATSHYFIDGFVAKNREETRAFARQRLRMYPPLLGNSTYMRSLPNSFFTPMLSSLNKLFTAAGFWGIFSAEFKLDSRTNEYKLIEINTRPWWFTEFATRSGLNVCALGYEEAVGRKILGESPIVCRETYCMTPYYDHFARKEKGHRSVNAIRWIAQLFCAQNPWWRWSDPLPAVARCWFVGKAYVGRRIAEWRRKPSNG